MKDCDFALRRIKDGNSQGYDETRLESRLLSNYDVSPCEAAP